MGLISYLKPAKGPQSQGPTAVQRSAPASAHTMTPLAPPMMPSSGPSSSSASIYSVKRTKKFDIMSDYLRQQQLLRRWATKSADQGVVLKRARSDFVSSPSNLVGGHFMEAIQAMNVRCAMTVDTPVTRRFIGSNIINLPGGLRLQILPDLSYLPNCQKHQCAAFISDRAQLVVWDDDPKNILERVAKLEADLLSIIWSDDGDEDDDSISEKKDPFTDTTEISDASSVAPSSDDDVEALTEGVSKNRISFIQPVVSAIAIGASFFFVFSSFTSIVQNVLLDGSYTRLAFVAMLPFLIWTSLFFWQSVCANAAQLFGPVKQVHESSRFYSGAPPKRISRNRAGGLPHFTIQMPVYKEGLEGVIIPTIRSINAAIATYEMQGGSANIFINDDGMQLIPENERLARQEAYEEYGIGWTARPKHNTKPAEGELLFIRPGKFKKASNMNYGMWVSCRIEEKLQKVERPRGWSPQDEALAYTKAMTEVLKEDNGRTWADGDVRMGDYVLIIDSDTEVPKDCLLDAASEMEHDPRMAILQYASGVMNVTDTFFEKAITFFTNLVYTQIRYAVASGDVAPFVGHNAILRWDALQAIEYICPHDNRPKWWSEETVSEDFDMALRLQGAGYLVRLAGYKMNGQTYNEGVSLTVYDELMRWEKYAFGCSELLFHPLKYWFTRGPFTKLFRDFMKSPIPLCSKFTIMAYIGTYYAIGSSWLLSLANYFIVGWYGGWIEGFYMPGFSVYISLVFIFTFLGNVALAFLRWRTGEKPLLSALLENFSWIPLFAIFFAGISMHVSQALISHLLGIDMQWGSTAKEAEERSFFEEIPRVLKGFKWTFAYCLLCTAMMVVMAQVVPYYWRIDSFVAIFPLGMCVAGHTLLPIALNPNLIVFRW